ncbi:MAG: hypothetical protein E6J72_12570 [Deltaproteobacteria bacterium]|nr:MAG: hypothetical protein E6J72_12570 [Deltaproteobacteria bacterium]
MNTPAHAVLNLVLLGATKEPRRAPPVLLGAVLPDLPIAVLYAYERLRGMPEAWIWRTAYYDPRWQAAIDALHSFPLILAVLGTALVLKWPRLVLLCASMLLHAVVDFFLHHDDAHRHFFPLLDWRFASPVSYWDPRYFGNVMAPAEAIGVVAACVLIARTTPSPSVRGVVVGIALLYIAFLVFALHTWVGLP